MCVWLAFLVYIVVGSSGDCVILCLFFDLVSTRFTVVFIARE